MELKPGSVLVLQAVQGIAVRVAASPLFKTNTEFHFTPFPLASLSLSAILRSGKKFRKREGFGWKRGEKVVLQNNGKREKLRKQHRVGLLAKSSVLAASKEGRGGVLGDYKLFQTSENSSNPV
jgi:hypothetical protein